MSELRGDAAAPPAGPRASKLVITLIALAVVALFALPFVLVGIFASKPPGEWLPGASFAAPDATALQIEYWDAGVVTGAHAQARIHRRGDSAVLAEGRLPYAACRGDAPLPIRWLGPRELEITWSPEPGEVASPPTRVAIP